MESKPPVICVSICEEDLNAVEQAMIGAGPLSDLIEVRLDCLDHSHIRESFRELDGLLKNSPRPTVITYRPSQQGGKQELDNRDRLRFWLFNRPDSCGFMDIEFDVARNPDLFESWKIPDWDRVICSHHDFTGVPADLDQLYTAMSTTRARILKIAVQADDVIDCLPVFGLIERARQDGREIIAIAMGEAGIATRILGPSRGAFLTYASRENENATAAGQITARELRDVYRLENINRQTEIFGIAGWPVSQSLSPRIHNAAFAATKRNAVFIPFAVRDLPAFIRRMVHPGTREIDWTIRGLSVTAPHKLRVMDHLDWVEPSAKEIGAVNTIRIDENGLSGYNTDAIGFLTPLVERLGSLRNLRCAVVGAGGAASAAVWSLANEGARVTVFGRTPERVVSLANRFGAESGELETANFDGFDLVINATTLGMAGKFESESPVEAAQLGGARLAYDLVYNPMKTQFLRTAAAAGCETLGGIAMFVAQAAEQFRLWTGSNAPDGVIQTAAQQALEGRANC